MFKTKQASDNKSTNTYAYMTPPKTEDDAKLDKAITEAYDVQDPTIQYTFNNAREELRNSYGNPFGADVSPEISQKAMESELESLDQAQGQAIRVDEASRKQSKVAARAGQASAYAPQLVQTGGTSSGTASTQQAVGPAILQTVGAAGGAALM